MVTRLSEDVQQNDWVELMGEWTGSLTWVLGEEL